MANDVDIRNMRASSCRCLRWVSQGSSDTRAITLPPNQIQEVHCLPMQRTTAPIPLRMKERGGTRKTAGGVGREKDSRSECVGKSQLSIVNKKRVRGSKEIFSQGTYHGQECHRDASLLHGASKLSTVPYLCMDEASFRVSLVVAHESTMLQRRGCVGP